MKNIKRFSVIVAMLMVLCLMCTVLVACNNDDNDNGEQKYDPETRPFTMSISNPDGVFNPFYSSSGYDSTIVSMTQIGMLSTDKAGNITCGQNEPCVVLDYTVQPNTNPNTGIVDTTTYEFAIKNGIKWSNGSALTIKDVLFNLYVYLDPAFTGSATIYSTDIVGLKNYRLQTLDDMSDEEVSAFESQFVSAAAKRVLQINNYVGSFGTIGKEENRPNVSWTDATKTAALKDFAYVAKTFYEELNTDWNNYASDKDSYKDWGITETWQIFMLNDAGASYLLAKNPDGTYVKDEKGNYQLDKEAAESYYNDNILDYLYNNEYIDFDENDNVVYADGVTEDQIAKAIKECCIITVFDKYISNYDREILSRNIDELNLSSADLAKIDASVKATSADNFPVVTTYWGTAVTISEKFAAEAKSAHFAQTDRIIKNISGITVRHSSSFNGKSLGAEHDILTIKINGIDPKAIYNFAFTVSPMYYYSSTNWNNTNYIQDATDDFHYVDDEGEQSKFGVEFASTKFMDEVIKASNKIGVPMGAGTYMASTPNGGAAGAGDKDRFMNNNIIYYERNPYFYTVGTGLSNAKIKFVRYKVVESDQIINSISGDIDMGDPNATPKNRDDVNSRGYEHIEIRTSGYGYVGINPRFVPSVEVRRAIIKAMNAASIIQDYYAGGLGETIYRSMSKTNWAYPEAAGVYNPSANNKLSSEQRIGERRDISYAYDYNGSDIEALVKAAGYTKNNDGVYQKRIPGFGVDTLDYQFTIAGGSTDHPAYSMFLNATDILNRHGFNVRVVTSQKALTDLNSGLLAVWAAAWSSTIDPDMYQVYHMDSQASSVKNWGYSQILGGTSPDAWGDEYEVVVKLSKKIDEGRATNDKNERKQIYAEALDLVMELAVEFPTYQRSDMTVYKAGLLDPNTLPSQNQCSPYSGLLARMWEINYL